MNQAYDNHLKHNKQLTQNIALGYTLTPDIVTFIMSQEGLCAILTINSQSQLSSYNIYLLKDTPTKDINVIRTLTRVPNIMLQLFSTPDERTPHRGSIVTNFNYSGTPIKQTPMGQYLSFTVRCPTVRGRK